MTTTEIKEEAKTEEVKEEASQETEVKAPSPVEEAARAAGWVSKEEWEASGKDPAEWRSAKEFQERGELFEEIHKLKDVTKKQAAAFKVLVEHHKKVRESAMKEALALLKAQKKEALENHEIDRVFAIDEEIERVKANPDELPEVDLPPVDVGPTPTFRAWHKQNTWYSLDGKDEASAYANVIGEKIRMDSPNLSEKEFLEQVESKVARRFPELFENPASKRKSEVNPKSDDKPSTGSSIKLTEAEERVCKLLVEQGVMTRKQYVDEIKKMREG